MIALAFICRLTCLDNLSKDSEIYNKQKITLPSPFLCKKRMLTHLMAGFNFNLYFYVSLTFIANVYNIKLRKQQPIAGYFAMTTRLPYGCHFGCQGFVDSLLHKLTTTVRKQLLTWFPQATPDNLKLYSQCNRG